MSENVCILFWGQFFSPMTSDHLFLFSCSILCIETFLGWSLALAEDLCFLLFCSFGWNLGTLKPDGFTLWDTGVLWGRVVSTVFTTGATSPLVVGRKLGTFRDTEDDVIESDDSDMLWVDDAAECALDSMEQLWFTFCLDDVADGTFNSLNLLDIWGGAPSVLCCCSRA